MRASRPWGVLRRESATKRRRRNRSTRQFSIRMGSISAISGEKPLILLGLHSWLELDFVQAVHRWHDKSSPLSTNHLWWVIAVIMVLSLAILAALAMLTWKRQSRSTRTRRLLQISNPALTQQVSRALSKGEVVSPSQREIAHILVDNASRFNRTGWSSFVLILLASLGCVVALGRDRHAMGLRHHGVVSLASGVMQMASRRKLPQHAAQQGLKPSSTGQRPRDAQ
jgi:hypothetical protein